MGEAKDGRGEASIIPGDSIVSSKKKAGKPKRPKQEHAKNVMSIESFTVAQEDVWHEENQEQSACGRYTGHDDRPLEELKNGRWILVQNKDVCIHCGARRL